MLTRHAALVIAQPATHQYVRRYAQLHTIGSSQQPDPEGSLLDAISVLSLASVNDVEDYLVSDDYRAIEADEATFLDQERSEVWTGLKTTGPATACCPSWPRAASRGVLPPRQQEWPERGLGNYYLVNHFF